MQPLKTFAKVIMKKNQNCLNFLQNFSDFTGYPGSFELEVRVLSTSIGIIQAEDNKEKVGGAKETQGSIF